MRTVILLVIVLLLATCSDRPADFVAGPPVVVASPPAEKPSATPLFCFPHAVMQARLARVKAVQMWRGLILEGIFLELYVVTDHTGWATVIWHPDGFACLSNAGEEWAFPGRGG